MFILRALNCEETSEKELQKRLIIDMLPKKHFIPFCIQLYLLIYLKISCSPLLEGGKATLPPSGGKVKYLPMFSLFFDDFWLDSNGIKLHIYYLLWKQNRTGNFQGIFLTSIFLDFFDKIASKLSKKPRKVSVKTSLKIFCSPLISL